MSRFSEALRIATGQAAGSLVPGAVREGLHGNKRWYASGETNRLTGGWGTVAKPHASVVRRGLRALRARSREQWMNNPYVRRFGGLLKENVVGPRGMRLIARAQFIESGEKDDPACKSIQDGFKEWGRKQSTPEASGMSWHTAEKLFIETVARDGEVIIRHLEGTKNNKWRYSFQFIDAELLDVFLNKDFGDGSGIVMGVEVDTYRKPVAYHFLQDKLKTSDYYEYGSGSQHLRVPANEIEHVYLPEWIWQTRGIPWTSTALLRCNMLNGAEEAELVATRVAASKMGFYERTEEWAGDGSEFTGTGEVDETTGDLIDEAEPGTFNVLPTGYKLSTWDPQHPNSNTPDFTKLMLRGIASGLGASYNTLGNDMEGPNFGSLRVGLLAERDIWKALQVWMAQEFNDVIYRRWLQQALLAGALKVGAAGTATLAFDKYDKYTNVTWQPRSWPWIDPQKELTATQVELDNLLRSRSDVIRSRGEDPEEVFKEIAAENELFEQLGIQPAAGTEKTSLTQAANTDADGDPIDENGNKLDENGEPQQDENGEPIPANMGADNASGNAEAKSSGKAGAAKA